MRAVRCVLVLGLMAVGALTVADEPGVTRDINIGSGKIGSADYLVIDTGGIDSGASSEVNEMVSARA